MTAALNNFARRLQNHKRIVYRLPGEIPDLWKGNCKCSSSYPPLKKSFQKILVNTFWVTMENVWCNKTLPESHIIEQPPICFVTSTKGSTGESIGNGGKCNLIVGKPLTIWIVEDLSQFFYCQTEYISILVLLSLD